MKHLDFDSIIMQPNKSTKLNLASTKYQSQEQEKDSRLASELQQPSISRRSSLSSRLSQLLDKEEEIKKKLAEFDKRFGKRPNPNENSSKKSISNIEAQHAFEFAGSPKISETTYDYNRLYSEEDDNSFRNQNSSNFDKSRGKLSKRSNKNNTNKQQPEKLDDVFEVINEGSNDFSNHKKVYHANNDEPLELDDEEYGLRKTGKSLASKSIGAHTFGARESLSNKNSINTNSQRNHIQKMIKNQQERHSRDYDDLYEQNDGNDGNYDNDNEYFNEDGYERNFETDEGDNDINEVAQMGEINDYDNNEQNGNRHFSMYNNANMIENQKDINNMKISDFSQKKSVYTHENDEQYALENLSRSKISRHAQGNENHIMTPTKQIEQLEYSRLHSSTNFNKNNNPTSTTKYPEDNARNVIESINRYSAPRIASYIKGLNCRTKEMGFNGYYSRTQNEQDLANSIITRTKDLDNFQKKFSNNQKNYPVSGGQGSNYKYPSVLNIDHNNNHTDKKHNFFGVGDNEIAYDDKVTNNKSVNLHHITNNKSKNLKKHSKTKINNIYSKMNKEDQIDDNIAL